MLPRVNGQHHLPKRRKEGIGPQWALPATILPLKLPAAPPAPRSEVVEQPRSIRQRDAERAFTGLAAVTLSRDEELSSRIKGGAKGYG